MYLGQEKLIVGLSHHSIYDHTDKKACGLTGLWRLS